MVKSHHGQVQHIAYTYPFLLSSINARLKQQHTWTMFHPSSPCVTEILPKNYAQELEFSLWLFLHLHEIIFLMTLSSVIFCFEKNLEQKQRQNDMEKCSSISSTWLGNSPVHNLHVLNLQLLFLLHGISPCIALVITIILCCMSKLCFKQTTWTRW